MKFGTAEAAAVEPLQMRAWGEKTAALTEQKQANGGNIHTLLGEGYIAFFADKERDGQ